jgi:hypothetical protein
MNEQSLRSANDFLRVAASTVAPGEFFDRAPTEIGKDAGISNPLAVARAIRALAARRRVEMVDGRYRLLDATLLAPGEPESVPRTPRKRKPRKKATAAGGTRAEPSGVSGDRKPTYADLGRSVVDRLIELGRETGEALGLADNLRREVKENRAARIDAEQRSTRYFERIKELEHKLEMAEANLRTVLAAARGRGATAAPTDTEMEAVLRVLKGSSAAPDGDGDGDGSRDAERDGDGAIEPEGGSARHGPDEDGPEVTATAAAEVVAEAIEVTAAAAAPADGDPRGAFEE